MNIYSRAIKLLVLLLIAQLISACGYSPSSKFSRDILGQKISTSVTISAKDPENSVLIKDAVDSAIVESLQASLVGKNESDTHLALSISNPTYLPIQYDSNGFIVTYRMSVRLKIISYNNGISKNYITHGTYDFSVVPNAVITDKERFDAIKFSASKAINEFISKTSAEGARINKE
ncbi:MAG: LPS assembly lipoprotein LptE [Sulfurimonas sp.]|nr:LPS assembly lipoprotein LptE [Sulfurimonas sp.]